MKLNIESLLHGWVRALKTHRLQTLALLLMIACGAVFAYKLLRSPPSDSGLTLPVLVCNPGNAPCSVPLPHGGRLDFSISPNPIRPLQPLQLEVVLKGTEANQISADFQGVEMDMGTLRTQLRGNGRQFTGQTMLPVCTTGTMTWSATLHLNTSTRRLSVPFHFDVPAR